MDYNYIRSKYFCSIEYSLSKNPAVYKKQAINALKKEAARLRALADQYDYVIGEIKK